MRVPARHERRVACHPSFRFPWKHFPPQALYDRIEAVMTPLPCISRRPQDPAPALAAAFETASRVSELEAQCGKLAQELAEYKKEAAHIRNQELTVRR